MDISTKNHAKPHKSARTSVSCGRGSALFRLIGNLQFLRLAEELAEIVAEGGVFIAGADPLVHHHTQRHDLLVEIAAHVIRHRLAHADKHAGGAELVAMVVDIAGLDGGQIGDEHAGVEGAEVDDLPGQQTQLIQMVGQPDDDLGQQRDGDCLLYTSDAADD